MATSRPALPRVRRSDPARAFTLLELVAVLVVLAILASVASFAFAQTRRSQFDLSGKPVLGVAQAQARKVAASNGYTYPSSLMKSLSAREPAVVAGASSRIQFSSGASFSPKSARNTADAFLVSTATDGTSVAAFAVETSTDGPTGHCWAMLDDLTGRDKTSTHWGYSDNVPTGQCAAALALSCPSKITGTSDNPSDIGNLTGCAPSTKTQVPAPTCVIAQRLPAAARDTVTVEWTTPEKKTGLTGYTVLVFAGTVNPASLTAANATTVFPVSGAETSSAEVTGLQPGTKYTFAVTSVGEDGTSSISDVTASQAILPEHFTPPAAVTGVTATADPRTGGYKVSFTGVPGAKLYNITREGPGTTRVALPDVLAKTDATTQDYIFEDTTTDYGVTYRYLVEPEASDYTQTVCGTTTVSGGVGTGSWFAAPPVGLDAPVLTGVVRNANGGGWKDDAVLTWDEVPNATGYVLSRLNTTTTWTVTGTPGAYTVTKRNGTTTVSTTPATTLSATDFDLPVPATGSSLAATYRVKATGTNTTGTAISSADSNPYDALVEAQPSSTLNVAAFASAPGRNDLRWSATGATAGPYQVALSDGTVLATGLSSTTYTHTGVALGSNLTYVITPTAGNPCPTTNKTACSASALQYPADPVVTAVGSDTNGDKVPDQLGTNTVSWTTTAGAQRYQVESWTGTANGTSVTAKVSSPQMPATARSWNQTQLARGTERLYRVIASNTVTDLDGNTVVHYSLNANAPVPAPVTLKAAYQAPDENSGLQIAAAPTLSTDTFRMTWRPTADIGAASDAKFCSYTTNPGACSYTVTRKALDSAVGYNSPSDTPGTPFPVLAHATELSTTQSPGMSFRYFLAACNAGGCTNAADFTKVDTYPGKFGYASLDAQQEFTMRRYNENQQDGIFTGAMGTSAGAPWNVGKKTIVSSLRPSWTTAAGTNVSYRWNRTELNDSDAFNQVDPAYSAYSPELATPWLRATPSALYRFGVEARAENGLTRPMSMDILTSPSSVMQVQEARHCLNAGAPGWKGGFSFHRGGSSTVAGKTTDTPATTLQYSWWAGAIPPREVDAMLPTNAQFQRNLATAGLTRNGKWAPPGSWTSYADGHEYYDHGEVAVDQKYNPSRIFVGDTDPSKVIPGKPEMGMSLLVTITNNLPDDSYTAGDERSRPAMLEDSPGKPNDHCSRSMIDQSDPGYAGYQVTGANYLLDRLADVDENGYDVQPRSPWWRAKR